MSILLNVKKKNDKCSDSIIILQGFGKTLFKKKESNKKLIQTFVF